MLTKHFYENRLAIKNSKYLSYKLQKFITENGPNFLKFLFVNYLLYDIYTKYTKYS